MPKLIMRGRSGLFVPRQFVLHEYKGTDQVRLIVQSQKPGEPVFLEGDVATITEFLVAAIRKLHHKSYALPFYDDSSSHFNKTKRWKKMDRFGVGGMARILDGSVGEGQEEEEEE